MIRVPAPIPDRETDPVGRGLQAEHDTGGGRMAQSVLERLPGDAVESDLDAPALISAGAGAMYSCSRKFKLKIENVSPAFE